jgi:hypothetical protein
MKHTLKKILFLPFIGLMLILSSCPGKHHDIFCTDGSILLVGTGFNAADFNSGTIYKFKQDNLFDTVIDSQTASLSSMGADTFQIFVSKFQVVPGFDYKLTLPGISRNYLITNILQSGKTQESVPYRDPPIRCRKATVSCMVNGSNVFLDTIVNSNNFWASDTLIIQK